MRRVGNKFHKKLSNLLAGKSEQVWFGCARGESQQFSKLILSFMSKYTLANVPKVSDVLFLRVIDSYLLGVLLEH